jgi:hypothetical protein
MFHELIYHFCIDHPHFPIDVDDILAVARHTDGQHTGIHVTKDTLLTLETNNSIIWNMTDINDTFNHTAPVFIEEFEAKLPTGELVHCVRHLLFYAFNIGYRGFGCLPGRVGQHYGDFEEVVLIYNLPNERESLHKLYGMFTFAHGMAREARLTLAKDITFTGQRINVWIARNSNAHIPKNRTRIRFFGFANDVVSSHGISWAPSNYKMLEKSWWYSLPKFRWGGPDGPRTPSPISSEFLAEWAAKKQKDYSGLLVC